MPRNGTGIYTLPEAAFIPGTTISSSAVNDDFSDIAAALTSSIASDGQTPITAPLKTVGGTSTQPSWTFNADTTTGIYLVATGKLGLVGGGAGLILNSVGSTITAATAASGGANYAVGDTVTLTGGTAVSQAILTVATLTGNAVSTVTVSYGGLYTAAPASPASQGSSSGSGTGATFTLTTTSTSSLISTIAGLAAWSVLGATPYMTGAMDLLNGLALANYIGASNLVAAIQTSIPLPIPQGYLTPVSNTPVIPTDSTSASTVFYTPFMGTWAVIHNGLSIIPYQFTQMQLTLTSSQSASNIYDIFLAYNSNSPVIGTGPSWVAGAGGSITPGTCARGTGAGGTALTRLQGMLVNAVSMTLIYNTGTGNNSITVAANQGIYLGSIFVDGSAGLITTNLSYGQSRKRAIWNAFQQQDVFLKSGDSTSSWAPTSASFHPLNSNTANSLSIFSGLQITPAIITDQQLSNILENNPAPFAGHTIIGIGVNSTTVASGFTSTHALASSTTISNLQTVASSNAQFAMSPFLGIQTITMLEQLVSSTSAQITFSGTETSCLMVARWGA